MRVADYIVKRLYEVGTRHIFMVTGRGALFLNDAVAAHKEIKSVCLHHEQSAAYAAVAYSDYKGELGACMVSTGCAGTNALTGVLNAWQDGIPCVFISGQNKLNETSRFTGIPLRTYGQQEADIIPIVNSITKYSVMITDPNDIGYEVDKALFLAQNGRKGPVWIDVPLDVQNKRVDPDNLSHFIPEIIPDHTPSKEDLDYLLDSIKNSQRPALLIGSGIRSAEAIDVLEKFLNIHPIPVTYSGSAPDSYGLEKSLSMGSVGMMGCSRAGNLTVQNSDLLLVLGCRLNTMTTGEELQKFAREAKVIVVDIDEVEHSKETIKIDRLIIADVKKTLMELIKNDEKKSINSWIEKCSHWKEVFPKCEDEFKKSEDVDLYYLAESLSHTLPEDSTFISDSGLIELMLPTNISFKKGQRCIHPSSQGSMGFALPGLIGAHFASEGLIVAVIGDGSVMMNLQELETIRYNNIPAKILIINNNAYAVIRKRQIDLFRSRTIGVDPSDGISCPDFNKVANAFEIPYVNINNSGDLVKKLKSVMVTEGPVICEIKGKEDQDYIMSSFSKNSQNRFVRRPIEDQAPFLDRKVFLSEMVIDPIDQ
jgi:acetolactate synthase I/II/III large subunit